MSITSRPSKGWATCPVTENGFVRIASQPSYPSSPGNVPLLWRLLTAFCDSGHHSFWPDAISLLDRKLFDVRLAVAAHQVTDVYLLGLAVHHGGRLITYDRRIPVAAVCGGEAALQVLH